MLIVNIENNKITKKNSNHSHKQIPYSSKESKYSSQPSMIKDLQSCSNSINSVYFSQLSQKTMNNKVSTYLE